MIRPAAAVLLLLAACSQHGAPSGTPGDRIEAEARRIGLVEDPARADPVGVYTSESDRVCVVRAGQGYRIGATVDYGPGHTCAASGTARGRERLAVDLGGGCRFEATLSQGRLAFAAVLPAACERQCTGRASLAALEADRLSASSAEAAAFRTPGGATPCG